MLTGGRRERDPARAARRHTARLDATCQAALVSLFSPSRGGAAICCPKSEASSSALPSARSASSPARSLSRASCGTLQPHPFSSEKAVRRKPRSSPCSSGWKCLYPGGKQQPSGPPDSAGGGGGVEPDMTVSFPRLGTAQHGGSVALDSVMNTRNDEWSARPSGRERAAAAL